MNNRITVVRCSAIFFKSVGKSGTQQAPLNITLKIEKERAQVIIYILELLIGRIKVTEAKPIFADKCWI